MITGKYKVDILHEGHMLVDGGIAFAGTPRSEWETFAPPDEKNRVRLGLNQLLVRGNGINMLIDTGIGNKIRPKKRDLMGLGASRPIGQRLADFGLTPQDITHIVFSHLHYDHCGGATEVTDDRIETPFYNAMFFIQNEEWQAATHPDDISRSSYCAHDFLPLQEAGQLKLINGDIEVAEGIFLEVSGGHTAAHQVVKIIDSDFRVIYPGDICPTPHHLVTDRREAFDLFPAETIAARKLLLRRAGKPNTLLVFSHSEEAAFYQLSQHENCHAVTRFNEP